MAEFVLDASVAVALLLGEEAGDAFAGHADRPAIAPSLWPLEVGNVLLVNFRRKRLSAEGLQRCLGAAGAFQVKLDTEGLAQSFTTLALLAGRHNLTIYDASYLELALRSGLPLASLDQRLRNAATAEGVPLIP
jgi:predicted nucleic acid-binding protein